MLFALVSVIQLRAQQSPVDSLINALRKHPKTDTVRLNLLNELAITYSTIDPDKGVATSDQAIELANRLQIPLKQAAANYNKAYNYSRQGQDSLALRQYQQALRWYQSVNNQAGIGKVYQGIGLAYFGLANYSKALEAHQQAAAISEKMQNKKRQAVALNSVGVNYMYLGNYPKALRTHLYVLRLNEAAKDTFMIANSMGNIGLVYKNLADYSKALAYQKKALTLYKAQQYQIGVANTLGNIATLYDVLNQPDTAIDYYQEAFAINQSINSNRGMASDLINIGIVYTDREKYTEALPYLKKALTLYKLMGDQSNIAIALNNLSRLYVNAPEPLLRKNGIKPSQRYALALSYQLQGLQLAKETEDLATQRDIWLSLSETYNAQQNFGQELSAYKKYISLRDSLINEEKKLDITRQEMQFEQEKREAVLKAKHIADLQQKQFERNVIIGGSTLLLLSGSAGFLLFKRRREANQKRQEAELRAEIADTEMKALRAQMNPHFIFNSLNSISDYVNKHDTESADYYLTKFARLMRLILENSEQEEVTLAEDLQALELYMQLEAMRLTNRFTYAIQIDTDIDPEETLVPPLILQPFVENSIWHGLAHKQGGGHVSVRIQKDGKMLNCTVEDNGVGRQVAATQDKTGLSEKKSLGMKITNSRISLLNRRKQTKAAITFADLPEGTRVDVKLPLELSV